ncbi:MAG: NAD+ synthase [Calditrichaeota bacterium]|jgi:NAD+ synthase (glutamine-hydrolysing)|nr:NAD+ synthase [Calditrichota bacterium]
MKIALAQINTTIGDFQGNANKIIQISGQAKDSGADLCVFPEQCIPGYPAHDLLERTRFIDQNLGALDRVVDSVSGIGVIVGFAERHNGKFGKGLYNSAALIDNGKISFVQRKSLLPTYDVFDESRYFDPAQSVDVIEFHGMKIGITICEDVWNDPDFWKHRMYNTDPGEALVKAGASIIINIAASPFTLIKRHFRRKVFSAFATNHKTTFCFVNSIGGNDDLVFDGDSMAFNSKGELICQGREFKEDLLFFDTDGKGIEYKSPADDIEAAIDALVLGTRDYARKCGFTKGLVGLSGGIDSALVAVIGARAFGAENMEALLMPSHYSSDGSIYDSENLARNLNISYKIKPISKLMDSYTNSIPDILSADNPGVADENIQARIRGNLLMALSNKNGHLLLTTGNKSELATGYCTLYGDMAGGLAVISDVPKSMVYEICHKINREKEIIPDSILTKPPSAELRPNQLDSDSLPPYDILDNILEKHIVEGLDHPALVKAGFDSNISERILSLVRLSEYKRRQAPPGIKLTSKAFGFGRRIPLAQRWRP